MKIKVVEKTDDIKLTEIIKINVVEEKIIIAECVDDYIKTIQTKRSVLFDVNGQLFEVNVAEVGNYQIVGE